MINCYPIAGKRKSFDICAAFAEGCNGKVITNGRWRAGPSMFFGVNDSNTDAWIEALLHQGAHDFYYADNAYFDVTRGTHFRITKNRLQHSGMGTSDGERLPNLNVREWRTTEGKYILICPQSDDFMKRIVGYNGHWLNDIRDQIGIWTAKKIRVREWNRNKAEASATLHDDLANAHACVVWSSAAGIESILDGVPTVVMGQAAARLFSVPLQSLALDSIPHPAGSRLEWASVLADNQWTLDEMRQGTAWRHLNKESP